MRWDEAKLVWLDFKSWESRDFLQHLQTFHLPNFSLRVHNTGGQASKKILVPIRKNSLSKVRSHIENSD